MRNTLAPAALLVAGFLGGKLLDRAPAALADVAPPQSERPVIMEVINSARTQDTFVFVYDTGTQRLAMYSVADKKGLALNAVRNTAYDVRIHELNNVNEAGTSLKDLKKAFEEEEAKKQPKKKDAAKEPTPAPGNG